MKKMTRKIWQILWLSLNFFIFSVEECEFEELALGEDEEPFELFKSGLFLNGTSWVLISGMLGETSGLEVSEVDEVEDESVVEGQLLANNLEGWEEEVEGEFLAAGVFFDGFGGLSSKINLRQAFVGDDFTETVDCGWCWSSCFLLDIEKSRKIFGLSGRKSM